ncbi:DNA-binding FadR family transcriptional regulator [Chitinophaga skermanii]|uniref:DNA-binding FadR family transcriptional regulator n=1 Tax=Chitinophaga skermanii TaxID=331697 RepID=A0A327R1N8_9BACT|nr:FadR/GntR family transcriptional regulator [Chitinophaga skermanii]RAJ10551.1 DNA-binding FadR family transcriptional regulator [Chitinophaga skermanii]
MTFKQKHTPIKKSSLAEEVAGQLQAMITSGKYKIDEKLPTEPALMEQYGVGRSSIREAIRILENNGIVRVQQGSGTYVAATKVTEPLTKKFQRAKLQDLDELRKMLEVKIAEKAAVNRTEKDIQKMRTALSKRHQFSLEGNLDATIEADIQFHSAIAEAAKNIVLLDLYQTIARHIQQNFKEIHENTDAFTFSQDLHQGLLDAIVAGDVQKATVCITKITSDDYDDDI